MPNQAFENPFNLPIDQDGYCVDPATGQRICGARKSSGAPGPCKKRPYRSSLSGRCERHGGKSRKGIAHPLWKGAGYSKYMDGTLREDYESALNDETLLELRSEAAVVDTLIAQTFKRLKTGESGANWVAAQDAMRELLRVAQIQPPDPAAQSAALIALRSIIDRGVSLDQMEEKLIKLMETKRKIAESETRRLVMAKQFVTLEKEAAYLDALAAAVREYVEDESIRQLIQQKWSRLAIGHRITALALERPGTTVIDAEE